MSARLLNIALMVALLATSASAQRGVTVVPKEPSATERRVALVIGNADYAVKRLNNPVNDARAMAATLKELGFQVRKLENADNRAMREAIDALGDDLRKGGIGLFYYSGHGMQVKGANYLIPVGAGFKRAGDVEFEAVDARRVLSAMGDAANAVNIVILDACRDNPYARSFRSASRGLAQMSAAGTLIAYSTAAGDVAEDGKGKNSPYTASLAKHLKRPGLSVYDVFTEVSGEVQKQSGGQQVPFIYSSLTGRLYLAGAGSGGRVSVVAPDPTVQRQDPASEAWSLVKESTNPEDFADFVKTFPESPLAATAQLREKQLRRAATPALVPVAPAAQPQQAAVQAPSAGSTFRDPITGIEFVSIPGGSYEQGCVPVDSQCHSEKPTRRVALSPFWLASTVVTQGQWKKVMGGNPSYFKTGDDHPVESVSWGDAQEFIYRLNALSGQRYRLPTEAEWEYACRSGGKAMIYGTNSGDLDSGNANYHRKLRGTTPVRWYPPNGLGLYDMSGNVRQWVQDAYGAYPSEAADNPVNNSGGDRVNRGGGYWADAEDARCSSRGWYPPSVRNNSLGFRLARTP